ncbi:MAG: DNA-directed polymerase subunit beta, partial [Acidimicrobiaceae bacterium]
VVEKKAVEDQRDADLEARAQKLEADMKELEDEGAKSDVKRKVRDGGEREMRQMRDRAQRELDRLDEIWTTFTKLAPKQLIVDEVLYRELIDRYGEYFQGAMGAESIKKLIENFDIDAEAESLRDTIRNGKGQKKLRALKRLKVVAAFQSNSNSPMGMVLDAVPVIPPELRPMVQLDGGRFATSDLNDLYRRVINRNNRLKRLIDLGAPEIIVNNEKRMLQESVDALFDNGRRGRPVTGPGNRPLKSLSDLLKGKQGRFRQNLLGKRVDYSGRSVIVVGPQLKLHQCGLPKQMALELFKPFVMKRLVDMNHAQNIKSAKRMVERARPVVWDVLEEVIAEHPVLLNRAPTLHRLGIQAFEPQLVEGKAIQIHPLVCQAFNADFDGDQMAVHLPLSAEAQAEARILMLASSNILSPASGRPIAMPGQDMVTGIYFLTTIREEGVGAGRVFGSVSEAQMAYDVHTLDLRAPVKIRLRDQVPPIGWTLREGTTEDDPLLLDTTLGRCLFNEAMPAGYAFVNEIVNKRRLGEVINDLAERYPKVTVAACLDAIKEAGFRWATRSGATVAIEDIVPPPAKDEILADAERKADKVEQNYGRGVITAEERRSELVEIWTKATNDVTKAMEDNYNLQADNPIWLMVTAGGGGNPQQIRQLAGMRGLVANPKGEIIPRPIKTNFREGLTVLEYFISTHGARKGLADTALRTADSGYLTRRLVDVSQDVIIREEDCGTERGVPVTIAVPGRDGALAVAPYVETGVYARTLAADAAGADGEVVARAGDDLGDVTIGRLVAGGVSCVRVRSVLTCEAKLGICAACYGRSLAAGKRVDVGEAVGIIAAQSIGEPGTQLTMRTFHTGGIAGDDITHGLPRVVELFEARVPKGLAPITESAGRVSIEDSDKERKVTVVPDDGSEELTYKVGRRSRLLVADGDHVDVGQKLVEGAVDPHEVLRIQGPRSVQVHLVQEVQEVYRSQGVSIHDKHIETVIRQMLKRVNVLESGDTDLLPGELVERTRFEGENRRVVAEGGQPASARPVLMGITKASLATESWLSAASFQETTRVLTDAAINARSDSLLGLKENVILGKLIPAGTGMNRYRTIRVEPTEEARAQVYAMTPAYDDGYDFGGGTGVAVPLDEYDYGNYR